MPLDVLPNVRREAEWRAPKERNSKELLSIRDLSKQFYVR